MLELYNCDNCDKEFIAEFYESPKTCPYCEEENIYEINADYEEFLEVTELREDKVEDNQLVSMLIKVLKGNDLTYEEAQAALKHTAKVLDEIKGKCKL